jgi:ethanolamine utilization microcompartment shell protein EutS
MPDNSHEATVVRTYLDTIFELPWNKETPEIIDPEKCKKILDGEHYGLQEVKKRILEYLAVREQAPEKNGSLGVIETFSAASTIKAADIAVKTSKVSIYELRVSRGMGGKGITLITGDIGDVTAAVEAGAAYAKQNGLFANSSVIAAPHSDLWEQI